VLGHGQRPARRRLRIGREVEEGVLEAGEGKPRVGPGEVRLALDGLTEERIGSGVVLAGEPVKVAETQVIGLPGIEVFRRRKPRQPRLVQRICSSRAAITAWAIRSRIS